MNGCFARELSLLGKLPDGVKVSSLAAEISSNPGAIEPHLGRYLDIRRDAFCALNTAFVEDGAYVHIPRGTLVEEPICLLFVSTGDDAPSMSHPRNLIVAEEDSQATFVEDYVSLDGWRGVLQHGHGTGRWRPHCAFALHDRAREQGGFQHLNAAYPARKKRQRRVALSAARRGTGAQQRSPGAGRRRGGVSD